DRHRRVDAVLVVQVDVIGAEAAQRPLETLAGVGGAAVDAGFRPAERGGNDPELRRDHELLATSGDGPADDLFTVPVTVGGVDHGDAELGGPVEDLASRGIRVVFALPVGV